MFNPTLGRRAALRRLSALMGGVATAPLVTGLLSGCRTPDAGALADYEYRTLSAPQQDLMAALVDQIIPATDTPGAAQAGVPQFADLMLTDWYAPDERAEFLAGLDAVDARARGSFVGLDDDARAQLVATMDAETYAEQPGAVGSPATPDEEGVDSDVAEAGQEGTFKAQQEQQNEVAGMQGDLGDAQTDDAPGAAASGAIGTGETGGDGNAQAPDAAQDGPTFFRQLKEITLAGYYTSEAGATQELQWLAAPGRYDADVPLAEVGRAWA